MKLLILIIALAITVFYAILAANLPGIVKLILAVAEMVVVGEILIRKYRLTGDHGLIMLKSRKGLWIIDKLAAHKKFWNFFADSGAFLSYGFLSLFLMRKNVNWKSAAAGFILLAFIFFLVGPFVLPFLASIMKDGALLENSRQSFGPPNSAIIIGIPLVLFAGGFFLLLLLSILAFSTFLILPNLLSTLLHGTNDIAKTPPGGTLLLPGINLPFFEGIISFLIILMVHEGAHAVLARIARVPILSSGIVLFGIIPVGAFVEPDEDKLKKLDPHLQTRVLVAGSTANLVMSAVSFILFFAFLFISGSLSLKSTAIAPVIKFITVILGLTFSLNFIIGTINMLPLPFFDGYRTLEINVPKKLVVNALMALTLAAFLLSFLPWLFR